MATKPTRRKSTSAGRRKATATATMVAAAEPALKIVPRADDDSEGGTDAALVEAPEKGEAKSTDDKLRRGDLIEAVSARVAVKRSDVKVVMDVLFEELGRMMDKSDDLILPPLGKLTVKKRVEQGDTSMLTIKLKRTVPGSFGSTEPTADTALAEDGEDS